MIQTVWIVLYPSLNQRQKKNNNYRLSNIDCKALPHSIREIYKNEEFFFILKLLIKAKKTIILIIAFSHSSRVKRQYILSISRRHQ
jgi:hypothetical protein